MYMRLFEIRSGSINNSVLKKLLLPKNPAINLGILFIEICVLFDFILSYHKFNAILDFRKLLLDYTHKCGYIHLLVCIPMYICMCITRMYLF